MSVPASHGAVLPAYWSPVLTAPGSAVQRRCLRPCGRVSARSVPSKTSPAARRVLVGGDWWCVVVSGALCRGGDEWWKTTEELLGFLIRETLALISERDVWKIAGWICRGLWSRSVAESPSRHFTVPEWLVPPTLYTGVVCVRVLYCVCVRQAVVMVSSAAPN